MTLRTRPISRLLATGLVAIAALLVCPREAQAIEYELFIDVDTEDELYDLYITGQISEETFNTLVELRRQPIDLNQATRAQLYSLPNLTYDEVDAILAYRNEVGAIYAPVDLAAAGVLSRAKLASVLTFIQAHDGRRQLTATHGWVRYQTAFSPADTVAPPMALQARITTLRQLTIGGAALLSRQLIGNPVWDPNRQSLIAPEMGVRVRAPKLFAQWDTDNFGVIAGTYRMGFGQRLTFDNTDRYTPNGFVFDDTVFRDTDLGQACRESQGELSETPCPTAYPVLYTNKDYRTRDGLRGLAIGAKHLATPVGWLQVYGFGSWQTRQLYQNNLADLNTCEDPRLAADSCPTAEIYVSREGQSPLAPLAKHKFQTLPNMYDEFVGGGNFSWFYDRRTHVGLTGYGAAVAWRPEGAQLDFRRNASTPFGGSFGAIGADMSWGHRWSDLSVEFSRSFDSMTSINDPEYGGGGYAGIARHTATLGSHEIETSVRYYGEGYANPFAGPIAQSDQLHGNRARDEAGGRIRYGGRLADRLDLRALADVWVQPRNNAPKMQAFVRGDVDVKEWFRPGLWLEYRNVDLRPNHDGCIIDTSEDENPLYQDTTSRSSGCISERGKLTGRLGFRPLADKLSITAQYQHEFNSDPTIDGLRQDVSAAVILRAKPIQSFRITSRFRYFFEHIADNTRYQQYAWAYLDMSYTFRRVFVVQARYDLLMWLDDRDNTSYRVPNPEHRLRLVLEARF